MKPHALANAHDPDRDFSIVSSSTSAITKG
jgi:hypothetical protein